jgi:hypothetical protein
LKEGCDWEKLVETPAPAATEEAPVPVAAKS